ncbi:MAG: imidazole glycerol phosphate synthase subunit HisH, partial [Actinomycetota bacterium]|nr:imidazole glycerol phosphate synthase subunit HisH [Actinomycetota bacterium]
MTHTIAVVDYGSGNLHSVSRAITRVGASPVVTRDADKIAGADALVIPGVGHFGACMRAIRGLGMHSAIEDFRATGRPVFGVCVGMQVLFEGSDEDPEVGLGVFPGRVERIVGDVKVPHMGWN